MKIGSYEVAGELGRGGMGVVYRVRAPGGGDAALKLLLRADAGAFARFERERRLLASLGEEQGFVGLLDAGTLSEGAFLVMPFLPGGTLRQRLKAGPLGVEETIALGVGLARALGNAHERGIVHRDVKPENVLFASSGRPLLADLGLARHFDRSLPGGSQSLSQTAHGTGKGTPGYMAPEQLGAARSVGPPADVFALGALLHECLSGRRAFSGDSTLEVFARVSSGTVEPLGRKDVPPWFERVLRKALAVDPAARFADGAAFARALRSRDAAARRRLTAPLLGGALAGILLLGVFLLVGRAPATPAAPPATAPAPPVTKPAPSPPSRVEPLPAKLRRADTDVPAADGKEVPLYLYELPDGSELELVSVPPGEFVMGTDDADANEVEKPRHTERLDHACWIGRNDVTWRQYRAYCTATRRMPPGVPTWLVEVVKERTEEHPAVMVTWQDASDYCRWAGLALPREVEWERAARGTDGRKWPWGNDWDPGSRCNFADRSCPLDKHEMNGKKAAQYFQEQGLEWDRAHDDGYPYTSPVGSFPRGVSPVGALDMAGNVWQWCEDVFDEALYKRGTGGRALPASDGAKRSLRGGCWRAPAAHCRSTNRAADAPGSKGASLGFRVVLRES